MIDRNDWSRYANHLIGVIDLKAGVAVHAIAGDREQYQPVSPLFDAGQPDRAEPVSRRVADGDPAALVRWYQRFGVRRFYVADLDSLTGSEIQRDAIASLLSLDGSANRWMIDVGLRDSKIDQQLGWIDSFNISSQHIDWIVASESASSVELIETAASRCDASSLIVGVDFRGGRFMGPDNDVVRWMSTAERCGLNRALVLDVSVVGTGRVAGAVDLCRDMSGRFEGWQWISGGGCRRPDDVDEFLDAGCDACLIASALLPRAANR